MTTPTSKEPTRGVGEEDFSAARDLSLSVRAEDTVANHEVEARLAIAAVSAALDWEQMADEISEFVAVRLAPMVKRASDDLYERLLVDVQDYLADNIRFNLGERLRSADAQALRDRQARIAAEEQRDGLLEALDPFAEAMDAAEEQHGVGCMPDHFDLDINTSWGALRAARAAVAKARGE